MNVLEYDFYSLGMGGKTRVIINNGTVKISRPGLLSKLSHGFAGEKTISIKDITAIQFKPVGFSRGYLQFVFPGTKEHKSGILYGEKDENTIYFDSGFNNKEINNNAIEIKEYIEKYKEKIESNTNGIYNSSDKYDKLAKIKKLLDSGTINQEEFNTEKEKILKM